LFVYFEAPHSIAWREKERATSALFKMSAFVFYGRKPFKFWNDMRVTEFLFLGELLLYATLFYD